MALLIIERVQTPEISVVTTLTSTPRGDYGFGSTDKLVQPQTANITKDTLANSNKYETTVSPTGDTADTATPYTTSKDPDKPNKNEKSSPLVNLCPPPELSAPPAAAAASLTINTAAIARYLHFAFDMPYDLHLSDDM